MQLDIFDYVEVPKNIPKLSREEVDFYLMDLRSRFSKIDHKKWALSYSGGRDSHRLYHLIKMWGFNEIKIVAINTFMEHSEIRKRMEKYADDIIFPYMKPMGIKEKYGSPCFSKLQDDIIKRYQNGTRSKVLMNLINGLNKEGDGPTFFGLNKCARTNLLNGTLHKVSPMCCHLLKKRPFSRYAKKNDVKAIIAVRGDESLLRKSQYKGCFSGKNFTPTFDLTDKMAEAIDYYYDIEIPKVYQKLNRTGCMGCPYGKKLLNLN